MARASKLSKSQKEIVEAAVKILKDYEACCNPTNPDGMDADVSIAACLESILKNSKVCRGGTADGALGQKTLDDKSANCGDQDIIKISRSIIKKKTRSKFVLLLMVLYHESVHALQDLSAFTTPDYKEKTTAKLEKQAWTAQKGFLEKFKEALEKIIENIENEVARDTGMDDCQRKLMECYLNEKEVELDDLEDLLDKAEEALKITTETLTELCNTIDEKCPPKAPAAGKPRNAVKGNKTEQEEDEGDRQGPLDMNNPKVIASFPRSGDLLLLERGPAGRFDLEFPTGLTEVFGIAWQRDVAMRDHVVVSGHRNGAGTVQIWRDDTPDLFDALVLISELDVDPVTSAPSGLAPFGLGGTGGLLVWDELSSELFAMVDGDADGVAELLDPTPRNLLPHVTSDLVELELDSVDEQTGVHEYTLSPIALGEMTGDLPWVSVVDADADGFFTPSDVSYRGDPRDDPRGGPGFGSRPMSGFTSLIVTGAEGHDVQLWQSDVDGLPVSPLTSVATLGPDNEVTLAVTDPNGLVRGETVMVLDLSNGTSSNDRPVEAAGPAVNRAFGNRSPGIGGQIVFQRGDLLDTLGIQDVLVGGNSAISFVVDATGVTYTTPPNTPVPGDGITDESRIVAVGLVYQNGGNPAVLPAQPLAYFDPILTDDYECRKGNVGAASGIVSNVLFANGFAGNGSSRFLLASPTEPFVLDIAAPPSLPGGPSKYAMYAWIGEPASSKVVSLPRSTGIICRHTPLDGPPGLPKRIANNLGKPQLGTEQWPGPPTLPAPYVLLDIPNGLGLVGTFTFQGIILDDDAPNGLAAVTNALVVESRP